MHGTSTHGTRMHGTKTHGATICGCLALALVALAGTAMGAQDAKPVKELKIPLTNGGGQRVGTAVLKQKKDGVQVKVSLNNMTPGDHGVHIHQNAVCQGPDFKSAGGHFNPDTKQHGFENPTGHHAGDTPSNLTVGANGNGSATWMLTAVTLQPGATNSLLSNGGTSLMVHEKADDMKTDPSGGSGNRIACGVIKQP